MSTSPSLPTNIPTPGPIHTVDETSLVTAQSNVLNNSVGMVSLLNKDLLFRYKSLYNNYVLNAQSGGFIPEERRHAPIPPFAWELAPANDDGFVFYQISTTTRIADPKDYPDTYYAGGNPQPNTAPNMIMIGARNGSSNWFTALKGDTFPNGMSTPPETSSDGVFGVFEKFGAPVGPGWYLLKN